MTIARTVYVISDLHVGGSYPDPTAELAERKRGFRMMTHVKELAAFIRNIASTPSETPVELIINGDFLDFLAEEKRAGQPTLDLTKPPEWTPFRWAREEALDAFRAMCERDAVLFAALREFLDSKKTLTIIVGNHDIELTLPDVRAALEAALPGSLRFITDGQALDLGEVVIDHGNLFDPANVVDHDALRTFRSIYSRGWSEDIADLFTPPAGSKLVATVMNPIKVDYGFIDLLKPESEPLFALLLAIEPSYRRDLGELAIALASAAKNLVPRPGRPWPLRDAAGRDDAGAGHDGDAPERIGLRDAAGNGELPRDPADDALTALVREVLRDDPTTAATLSELHSADALEGARFLNVADGSWRARWSLLRLVLDFAKGDLASRIPHVAATLRVLVGESSFSRSEENTRYLGAATWLATQGSYQKGYKAVIFGHTHHAKAMSIPGTGSPGARYFNTGTWANLMKFPDALTDATATEAEILEALTEFASDLAANRLDKYLIFQPTYVRLELGDRGQLIKAELRDYDWINDRL